MLPKKRYSGPYTYNNINSWNTSYIPSYSIEKYNP